MRAAEVDKAGVKAVSILLVDVVSFLAAQANPSLAVALKNAERDEEWLVLPLDPAPEIPGELTSALNDGCLVHDFEKFQVLRGG